MSVAVTNSKKHHSIKKRPSPVAFFVHVCNLRNHLASNKYIFPISPIMTNKYFLLIMIMLSSASCRQNDSFTLSGDLQGLKAGDTLLFEAYEPAFYTPTSQDTKIIIHSSLQFRHNTRHSDIWNIFLKMAKNYPITRPR